MVTHIVHFKLHDRSPEGIAVAAGILRSMAGRIPTLRALEVGLPAPEDTRSYDIALVTRFDDWAGLAAYRSHPYHQDPVLKHMHEHAAAATFVDYEGGAVDLSPT
jgi:hypothetical protein